MYGLSASRKFSSVTAISASSSASVSRSVSYAWAIAPTSPATASSRRTVSFAPAWLGSNFQSWDRMLARRVQPPLEKVATACTISSTRRKSLQSFIVSTARRNSASVSMSATRCASRLSRNLAICCWTSPCCASSRVMSAASRCCSRRAA